AVAGIAARNAPADIRLMADGGSEADQLIFQKHRLENIDIRQMRSAAGIRIVGGKNVARANGIAEFVENRADCRRERAHMDGQAKTLRHEMPVAGDKAGRKVHGFLDDVGARRADDSNRHFIGNGVQAIAQQRQADGISGSHTASSFRVIRMQFAAFLTTASGGTTVVVSYSSITSGPGMSVSDSSSRRITRDVRQPCGPK